MQKTRAITTSMQDSFPLIYELKYKKKIKQNAGKQVLFSRFTFYIDLLQLGGHTFSPCCPNKLLYKCSTSAIASTYIFCIFQSTV